MLLVAAQFVWGQSPGIQVGENTHLNAGGLLSLGYAGDYGDQVPSSHGLNTGASGNLSGYYYNPNFISFNAIPYYNQSRADSSFQSLTSASGISGTANIFTGSHFPGSFNYRYDHNSSGTFGLAGQPNFTTVGNGQGFGIGWSALLPNLPTLSAGYSQGSGTGTVYGTSQETSSNNRNWNLRSTYELLGFRLNGYYDHMSFHSLFPQFLAGGGPAVSDSGGHDLGFGTNHNLPLRGSFFVNYNRSSFATDHRTDDELPTISSNYTTSTENAGANFHPVQKLNLYVTQSYTSNLAGSLTQSLVSTGAVPPTVNLGSSSNSLTLGGGASYQFTQYLAGGAQATHFQQYYFGQSYSGTYASGNVNYGRRLLNLFTFSASVVDSANGMGSNAMGLSGTVNYFHPFGFWETSGSFTYAQNVQTLLVSYTTSYYQYSAHLHRRFSHALQWTAGFNGNRSGLTQQAGTMNHSESYSTSFGSPQLTVNALYNTFTGNSVLSNTGLVPVLPTPGLLPIGLIVYDGSSYSAGISLTPLPRLVLSGSFSRAISTTIGGTVGSHNDTKIFTAQMQYHWRRIGLQAGYTRFNQAIGVLGSQPGALTSYFFGVSRWFDFF